MTSDFVRDTCLLLRHDGCKKGTYGKGGRCVPAKGALLGAAGGSLLTLGAAGAGAAWMNTKQGQRKVGEAQQAIGKLGYKASGMLPKKIRGRAEQASSDFAANGADRYAKNAMTKEEVKKEYDRKMSKSKPRAERALERKASNLERQLASATESGLSNRESRRLEKTIERKPKQSRQPKASTTEGGLSRRESRRMVESEPRQPRQRKTNKGGSDQWFTKGA